MHHAESACTITSNINEIALMCNNMSSVHVARTCTVYYSCYDTNYNLIGDTGCYDRMIT